ALVRVEIVEEPVQVVLVGSPAVEQHQGPLGLASGMADEVRELIEPGHRDTSFTRFRRGSGSGVRMPSSWPRRCSNAGGSDRDSPRCARSSSVAKPGPMVAISNRTPPGSRK